MVARQYNDAMRSVRKSESRMTAAQYLEWERQQEGKHEFLDGEVFAMAGGTRNRSLISSNTVRALGNALADGECQAHGSDMRIHVERTSLYAYPDASVVCPPIEGESDDVISNLVLIVEVLSPSTEDYDRGTKFAHYRQIASLTDYIVIAQDEARVEHHSRTDDGNGCCVKCSGLTVHTTVHSYIQSLRSPVRLRL